jgi:hypothetical protein
MKESDDDRLDAALMSALSEEPLAGDVFTRAVMARVQRRSGHRRLILTIGWVAAAAVALATFPSAPAAGGPITPALLAAMMVLSAMSSLAWTAAED